MANAIQRAGQFVQQGRLDLAARVLEESIRVAPKDSAALLFLAELYERGGDPAKALQFLRKATNAAPNHWETHVKAAHAYLRMGKTDESIKRTEIASGLAPREAAPRLALGLTYLDTLKRPSVARGCFAAACELAPGAFVAWYHLAKAEFQLGRVDAALANLREALRIAQEAGAEDMVTKCLEVMALAIPGASSADNGAILAARQAYAARIEPAELPTPTFDALDRSADRTLNVGYVSSFFNAENWMKPVWGLINDHDRERYQVRLFSYGPVPSEDAAAAGSTGFRPHDSDRIFDIAALDDAAVARLMREEKIDVLVDLNGYSDPRRLGVLTQRPAPVLCGWFNMYATTGLRSFDYLIGDKHVVLPEEEGKYTERIVRVPGSYLTFNVNYPVPDVATAPCERNGYITFGSLCSRYKFTPETLRAWAELLNRCPTSRLLLRNGGLTDPVECEAFLADCRALGMPTERVEVLGRVPHMEFLQTYERIDIALDTFPYNGGTTTTEAIWQGVPVVAFAGPTWAGRTSATLLREGGLGDWVSEDAAGYVDLAARWGTDPDAPARLAALRAGMRAQLQSSPVCNTGAFARAMEGIYRDAWDRWRAAD